MYLLLTSDLNENDKEIVLFGKEGGVRSVCKGGKDRTVLTFTDGEEWYVKETPEEIWFKLERNAV